MTNQNVLDAVTWLKYCRYGVKLYPMNQSKCFTQINALTKCNVQLTFNDRRRHDTPLSISSYSDHHASRIYCVTMTRQ